MAVLGFTVAILGILWPCWALKWPLFGFKMVSWVSNMAILVVQNDQVRGPKQPSLGQNGCVGVYNGHVGVYNGHVGL